MDLFITHWGNLNEDSSMKNVNQKEKMKKKWDKYKKNLDLNLKRFLKIKYL